MPKITLKKITQKNKNNSKSMTKDKSKLTKKTKQTKQTQVPKKSLSNSNSKYTNDTKDDKDAKNAKDAKETNDTKETKDIKDIIKNKTLLNYIPPVNKHIVYPKNKLWELPNRKHFYNWINDTYSAYEETNSDKPIKKELPRIKNQIELNNIQRLTRDYLQGESPARGLLLYIGLGHGKTCAAIAIAEAILTKKEVLVISKANLENNFRKEIRTCGSDYFKSINHWVFNTCSTVEQKTLAEELGIPSKSIAENGGAFFIDFTNNISNYNDLSLIKREKLDNQINHMIEKRFRFLHYDGRFLNKLKEGDFDNKIIIIDEVHNIGNTMNTKSVNAAKYYNLFMEAKNPKYIFLSGTPIINHVIEISKIYNILRGYMNVLEIKFKTLYDGKTNIEYDTIKYMLKKNKHIDQIIIDKTRKLVKVTKNPEDFVTHSNGKGIIYSPEHNIDFLQFKDDIINTIQKMGYKISTRDIKETCFPEDKDEFERQFYNPDINKLKNINLIKRRIVGLTSYYGYQDEKLYPKLLPINTVQVPMSLYQLSKYEKYRHEEIVEDKNKKRQGEKDDQMSSSSYRIKSRFSCSFVFPEDTGSPYDNKDINDKLLQIETLSEQLDDFTLTQEEAEKMKKADLHKNIIDSYMKLLSKDKAKYLDIKNNSLAMYAPKYLAMISNINKETGKIFIYSYFKTLIGLRSFAEALLQTDKWAPFRIKKTNIKGEMKWILDENEDEKHKHKYIFYTGSEDTTKREIYRNIYNSQFENLDITCSELVKQLREKNENNYYGEVIKMIMTTRTGAEGLDLKEVRYIHILEPYWQPVLITQIIGRGVRNKSHLNLAPKDQTVEVFIYMSTITPELVKHITYIDVKSDIYTKPDPALINKAFKVVSSDEYLYMIAEKKKKIVNEFQKLMKETAFDCSLNYSKNILNSENKGLMCMDYDTQNRDDYIYTPSIGDTIDTIDVTQEKLVYTSIRKLVLKNGKTLYIETKPNSFGKMYIYDETFSKKVREPKPVGEVKINNGKESFVFYKKKNKKNKK